MERVLVIEDEKRVADLLKKGLEEKGYFVMVAYDGIMGLRLFKNDSFNLVISDIILPQLNGFEVCKEIKDAMPGIPVIMLTALGSTDDKLDGFDSGADDYMVKPFDFRELNARIKVLLKRNQMDNAKECSSIIYSDIVIDINKHEVKRNNDLINLTPKEYKLLLYMIQNPERVISRTEIAEKVWETKFDTGTNFIDVYINYLRNKIDKTYNIKLIHTKTGMGFILSDKQ